ncbi:MAG: hypothetical protein COB02_03765 [Candidatus Cloacimonadota bacterium]|nr:MAG: hypothetical protein COB02_03765 [Candidatus Cloacimonadota bacterium]
MIPSFYPAVIYGGPIFSVLNLLKPISKLGINVLVSTTNANGKEKLKLETSKEVEIEKSLNVKYYNDTFLNFLSVPMILNMFKDFQRADIINIQSIFSMSTLFSLVVAKILSKKIILTPRGSLGKECLLLGRSHYKLFWIKYLLHPLTSNIYWHATCQQEKDEILDLFDVSSNKIFILANGINVSEYQNKVKLTRDDFLKKYTGKNNFSKHIIVSLARIHEKKGLDILIKSFAEFKKIYEDAVLVIAGPDGGSLKELQSISKKMKISSSVFFPGNISGVDKTDFLSVADLFVLPSHNENFGIVYAEALASATPIVASKKTPWKIAVDFNCGKWVENSISNVSKAMIEIFDEDLEKMGKNGKELVKNNFDWNIIAKNYFKKLHNIMKESE